jgi:hypothetical protein
VKFPDHLPGDIRVWAGAGAVFVLLVGSLLYRWRSRPPNAEEIERRRRLHVNQVGRIAEGRVTELIQTNPSDSSIRRKAGLFSRGNGSAAAPASRQMVCYTYSISGVTYETAQDVTGLEERVHLHRIVAGQPASVKYDPSNPSNSILVADDWSGMH